LLLPVVVVERLAAVAQVVFYHQLMLLVEELLR
jgi:hypothetical protein